MDREALNDYPMGKYDVTVTIREFDKDRQIAWTVLGQIRPPIGHIYGYRLEPTDGGTLVTSYYDWSDIDQQWRDAGIFPSSPRARYARPSASSTAPCAADFRTARRSAADFPTPRPSDADTRVNHRLTNHLPST